MSNSTGTIWKERQYGDLQTDGYTVQKCVATWYDLPDVMQWFLDNTQMENNTDHRKVEFDADEFMGWLADYIVEHPDLPKAQMRRLLDLQDKLADNSSWMGRDSRATYIEAY